MSTVNIVIAGHFRFPTGSAAASRIRHLARGLHELGHRVHVLTMTPVRIEADDAPEPDWTDWHGIPYVHAGGWLLPRQTRSRTGKLVSFIRGTRRAAGVVARRVDALRRSAGVDVVIGYSDMYAAFRGVIRYCRRERIPLVRDVVEWLGPDSYPGGRWNPMYWDSQIGFRRGLPQADGIVGISSFLVNWFSARGLPTLRVPAIIDPDAAPFTPRPHTQRSDQPFTITYLGNMIERDGPMLMIGAVRKVVSAGHDVKFNIVGGTENIPAAQRARRFVEADPLLRGRVKFWGRVSDDAVRRHLSESDALLWTRLTGRASSAAFPTRLPEYLVTGNPVIASAVSDVAEYLVNDREAIVVEPESVRKLADGITRLIELPDRGRAIGLAGRRKCETCFHYAKRARELAEFLDDVISRCAAGYADKRVAV